MTGTRIRVLIAVLAVLSLAAPFAGFAGAAENGTETATETATPAAPANPTAENNTRYNTTRNLSTAISTEYTVDGLRHLGTRVGGRPSVRRLGDGMIWYRHTPTGVFAKDDPANFSRYIKPRTVVKRDHIYLGGFMGWGDTATNVDVQVVTYNVRNVRYADSETNRTFTRQVPTNVTAQQVEKTLPGGDMFRTEMPIPGVRGEQKWVAMWVEGHREETQMAFRVKKSPAYASLPASTTAGRIKWATGIIALPMFLVAAGMLAFDKWLLQKVGVGPMVSAVEYAFGGMATLFLASFVFFDGVISAFAKQPFLIGALGGVFLGAIAIWFFSDDPEEWLFLQPTAADAEMDETGAGSWHWANRSKPVIERGRDGKKVVPRQGYLPLIARAWPFYDAAPILEFDAANPDHRTLDAPPEDVEIPDDAGVWERIRTHFTGSDDADEYDRIMVVDPTANDVVEHEPESFKFGMPALWTWPDEDSGIWIRDVPLPNIRFGLILGGLAFIVGAGVITTIATTSPLWGSLASVLALLACVVRPVEGTATAKLAPAHFDAVISNMIQTLEGYSERADRDHFREKYLTTEAKRRVETADRREGGQMTMFEEMSDRLAPDPDGQRETDGVTPSTNGATPDAGGQSDD